LADPNHIYALYLREDIILSVKADPAFRVSGIIPVLAYATLPQVGSSHWHMACLGGALEDLAVRVGPALVFNFNILP
jgi:hypothetical protein